MSLHVVTSEIAPAAPRPSASVRRVAELIGCDEATVRRLVNEGALEAYTLRRRSIMVFLDSVAAHQIRQAREPKSPVEKIKMHRRAVANSANEAAKARLRAMGYLR
jgi:hypothetical protein